MYVKTEKATIQERLKEIEDLKAENKRLEELLTKGKDNRIKILIKSEREWREIARQAEHTTRQYLEDREELRKENKRLKEKLEEIAKELVQHHEEYKNMADMVVQLKAEKEQAEEDYRSLENAYEKLKADIIYEEGLYD